MCSDYPTYSHPTWLASFRNQSCLECCDRFRDLYQTIPYIAPLLSQILMGQCHGCQTHTQPHRDTRKGTRSYSWTLSYLLLHTHLFAGFKFPVTMPLEQPVLCRRIGRPLFGDPPVTVSQVTNRRIMRPLTLIYEKLTQASFGTCSRVFCCLAT